MLRRICCFLYYGFAQWLPPSNRGTFFKAIRYQICRHMFASCGKNVNVEPMASFYSGKRISIGDNSGIGFRAQLSGKITIGRDVMMGKDVNMMTYNHKFDRRDIPMWQQGFKEEEPIVIHDDVWIGNRVLILPGVTVGRGAIIGACSVVTKDVPEYSIVAGNPARIIGMRP
jgi:maltose O-acetyltransferase